MTKYLLSVYQPEGEPPPPDELAEIMRGVQRFHDELREAGAWVFAGGLHDQHAATVVRVSDGEVLLTDGPFAESKEYLGGLCVVEAPDLDAALGWGRRAAETSTLPIEVRPFRW